MERCRRYDDVPPLPSQSSVNCGRGDAPSLNGDGDHPTERLDARDQGCSGTLPDDILIGVISRLMIRDAVATGAVSKRWRHLWKRVPQLSLCPCYIRPQGHGDDDSKRGRGRGNLRAAPARRRRRARQARVRAPARALRPRRRAGPGGGVRGGGRHAGAPVLALREPLLLLGTPITTSPAGASRAAGCRVCSCGTWASRRGLEGLAHVELTRVAVDDAGVATILSACGALAVLALKECRQVVRVDASHDRLLLLDVDTCRSLTTITVRSRTLLELAYKGHRVDVHYCHAPALTRVKMVLCNACPLDCVVAGAGARLPKKLFLQPPWPLHASSQLLQAAQYDRRFAGLKLIVLLLKTPWREHVASVAALLVAAPCVKELRVESYGQLPAVPPPTIEPLVTEWPELCSQDRLQRIVIGGFSGEPELVELVVFLLQRSPALRTLAIDTHRWWHRGVNRGWSREETEEDPVRCYYARGVAWTHLPPKSPSTVRLTIL
ncbi:hypothetical protein BS78_06G014700 [Paspalum vaginatum]|nr:hypothetical protein BS78_06G014700 [Paspalum vaginatum]